jgi:hypothetical protein
MVAVCGYGVCFGFTVRREEINGIDETFEEQLCGSRCIEKKQVGRAEIARKLNQIIEFPNIRDFKQVVQTNQMKNCPVTLEDFKICERIFWSRHICYDGQNNLTNPAERLPYELWNTLQRRERQGWNQISYRISNAHRHKPNLDRGANGGITGNNLRVIQLTGDFIDVEGIDNHQVRQRLCEVPRELI